MTLTCWKWVAYRNCSILFSESFHWFLQIDSSFQSLSRIYFSYIYFIIFLCSVWPYTFKHYKSQIFQAFLPFKWVLTLLALHFCISQMEPNVAMVCCIKVYSPAHYLKDLFIADGEGLPRSLVEEEAKFAHQLLSLYSLQVCCFAIMFSINLNQLFLFVTFVLNRLNLWFNYWWVPANIFQWVWKHTSMVTDVWEMQTFF